MSALPAAQSLQATAPAAAYVPALHDEHGVAGSLSVSAVPALQSAQEVDPAAAYVPALHDEHGVAGSLSVSAVPATHGTSPMVGGGGGLIVRSGRVVETCSWNAPRWNRVFGATRIVAPVMLSEGVNSMYELTGPTGPSSFCDSAVVPSASKSVRVVS